MDLIALLAQRGHAQLVQELERRWPGCGAHTKRHHTTGAYDVVWNGLLAPDVDARIGAYVDGWLACLKFSVRAAQDASPFADGSVPAARSNGGPAAGYRTERRSTPAGRPPARRGEAAEVARARLESLFEDSPGGES